MTDSTIDIHDALLGRTFKKINVMREVKPYGIYIELVAGDTLHLLPVEGVVFTDLFINTMYRAQTITELNFDQLDNDTVSLTIGNDHHVMTEVLMKAPQGVTQQLFQVKRVTS